MLIIPPFLLIHHHYVTMITGSHFVRAHDIPGDWLPVGGEYPFAREKVRVLFRTRIYHLAVMCNFL